MPDIPNHAGGGTLISSSEYNCLSLNLKAILLQCTIALIAYQERVRVKGKGQGLKTSY